MEHSFTEYLKDFGFTGVEAQIYEALLRRGAMTGYEVSKETGISRSNVYSSLAALTDKGAAYLSEGEATKYIAVEVDKFTDHHLEDLRNKAKLLKQMAPQPVEDKEGYITIKGYRHIQDKIRDLLKACELRVYVMAESDILLLFKSELEELIGKGKKLVILSDGFSLDKAVNYVTTPAKGQIRLITDSSYVLTGTLEGNENDTCLYSGQENLVAVMKEALKNKITLIELNQRN